MNTTEISNLMAVSKGINHDVSKSKNMWLHVISQIIAKAKFAVSERKEIINTLMNDDKRFAFLKTADGKAEDMTQLIDEYICKRKRLGDSVAKIALDCRSFIYTGEIQADTKKQLAQMAKPADASATGGLFGTIGGMFGFGGAVPVKEETKSKEDDAVTILVNIVNSEKNMSAEALNTTLTTSMKKLASANKEKASNWVMTLQKCFTQLFKSILYFYCEAHEVEKLKDFLTERFETVKTKMRETKEENKKLLEQAKSYAGMRDEMMKSIKDLNTSIVRLNQEKTQDKNLISVIFYQEEI